MYFISLIRVQTYTNNVLGLASVAALPSHAILVSRNRLVHIGWGRARFAIIPSDTSCLRGRNNMATVITFEIVYWGAHYGLGLVYYLSDAVQSGTCPVLMWSRHDSDLLSAVLKPKPTYLR